MSTACNCADRPYRRSDLLDKRRTLMERWARFCTASDAKVVSIARQ